jgi:hypothetical protein
MTVTLNTFRDKHNGACIIIGGGPSLKGFDFDYLTLPTFGVNNIFLTGYTPTYYCIEDRLVAADRAAEINAVDTTKFVGKHLHHILGGMGAVWINTDMTTGYPAFPTFSFDLNKVLYTGGTVTYMCLQLAFWMGFEEVYLIGIDHNYNVPESSKLVAKDVYESTEQDPNHYHPEYFGKGKRFHDPKPERMEKAYERAKEVFEHYGRKIYNATPGSKLDVFERVDLCSII